MEDNKEEKSIKKYPIITIENTEIILKQMKKCICKINNKNGKGTGFFCHIYDKDKAIPVLVTNNHVIDEEIIKENNIINVSLYGEEEIEIIINEHNKIYTNKNYDITMIEIKEEKIKNFIELDEIIFKDNPRINNENIYIIQYPADFDDIQKASVSFGIFNEIEDEFNINYLCSTFDGSSGSPILNLKNKKVIGVHKACSNNFNINKGTFLKAPIIEFLNNINIINKKNEINIQLKIENSDINKDVYFLDNTTNEYKFYIDGKDIEHNHDNLKELPSLEELSILF